jgi:hypothetical protein
MAVKNGLVFAALLAGPCFAAAQTTEVLEERTGGLRPRFFKLEPKKELPVLAIRTRVLDSPVATAEFHGVSLGEFLTKLYGQLEGTNRAVGFVVDRQHFSSPKHYWETADTVERQINFPPYPKKMAVATALKLALSQLEPTEATFVIRRGYIQITTKRFAETVLETPVVARYAKKPLAAVLDDLAERSGVPIIVDRRIAGKTTVEVSAKFLRETSLATALDVLTDMAALDYVVVGEVIYVTSTDNARRLEMEGKAMPRGVAP